MEDDADWDVNLKQQLADFARGSKFLQDSLGRTTRSPYGDDWDILWLGHCGVYHGPRSSQHFWIARDDPTAVPPELHRWARRRPDMRHPLLSSNFTRYTFEAKGGLCANAYAVSQRGARIMLHQETQSFTPADVADRALARVCNDYEDNGSGGRCIAPYPSLFSGYLAPGPSSKASDRRVLDGKWIEKGMSHHIVFSTRMNMKGLLGLRGAVKGLINSQWPSQTLLPEYSGVLELPKGGPVWVDEKDYTS